MIDLRLGDCLEVLPTLDLSGVDAVIMDPPYGIAGGKGKINLERGRGEYTADFDDTPQYIAEVVVPAVKMLIKACGCVVVTPGNKNFALYPQPDSFGAFYQPAGVGLQVFGNADAQPIFYYGKNPTKKNMGARLSWEVTETPEPNGHPCPKPLKAWKKLVASITLSGHTVLDPFMGSGTTGVACAQLGRNFIGIELDPAYYAIAQRRIEQAAAQPALFTV